MTTTLSTKQDTNLETFSLIWLDPSVNRSEEHIICQQRLRKSINYIKTFEDSTQCEQYIRSISQNDRVVLIVSGRLGQQLVPRIHNLRQLTAIYVYCMDKRANEEWAKQFSKVKSVIIQMDHLVTQIQSDQIKREHDKVELPFVITIFNPYAIDAQSGSGSNNKFIHSQLLIDYLLDMESIEVDKKEFLSLCKDQYKDNDEELKLIEEFQLNYIPNQVFSWYTKNCFLKRIINKAFEIQNISIILRCGFFIRDIRQQLEKNKSSTLTRVYHSQLMSKEELNILHKSIEQYISINTFLSATPDRQYALSILQGYNTSNDIERVLFEIEMNSRFHGMKPFGDITSCNSSPDVAQIFLMVGSIFRIEKIQCEDNGIFIVLLTKVSEKQQQFKTIMDTMKNEYRSESTTLLSFAHMLWKMGKWDDAENCYYRLLETLPDEHVDIPKCYHALGNVASDRGDYNKSLQWHFKSLDIKRKTLSQEDPSLAYSYNNIGAVYQQKGEYEQALKSYQQALKIWKKANGENHVYVAMCYNNMGLTYQENEKYTEALDYYQKVLNIRQKLLSDDHPDLGDIHRTIGIIYRSLNQFDLGLEEFNKSLKIFKKSLHSQHSNVALVLNHIGTIYEDKNQLQAAAACYQEAIDIYRQISSTTHPDFIETEENLKRVTSKLKK